MSEVSEDFDEAQRSSNGNSRRDNIYIANIDTVEVENYLEREQSNTVMDMLSRVHPIGVLTAREDDITILVDGKTFNQEDYINIQSMSKIIKDSGEIGSFNIGNLIIHITQMNEYQSKLIKL